MVWMDLLVMYRLLVCCKINCKVVVLGLLRMVYLGLHYCYFCDVEWTKRDGMCKIQFGYRFLKWTASLNCYYYGF